MKTFTSGQLTGLLILRKEISSLHLATVSTVRTFFLSRHFRHSLVTAERLASQALLLFNFSLLPRLQSQTVCRILFDLTRRFSTAAGLLSDMTGLCSAETGTWSGPVWLTSAGSGPSWSSSASRWSCSARSQFSSQGRRRQHPEEQPPSPSWEVLSGRRESESESTRPSRSKFSRLIKIIHLKLFLIPYILHVLESWLGLSKRL